MTYSNQFIELTGKKPRDYQLCVADTLVARRHVLLRAPTGAGKTFAVLVPFLLDQARIGARRLIYTLPLRSLGQSIHADAASYARQVNKTATIQTGSQPDDPFLDQGDIIVSTYDQLLSGYLCGPYSLPARLHNINAAAVAGNLVVFDEFHLMDPGRAFLTGIHSLKTFGGAALSVWMTATATTPLCEYLKAELNAVEITLDSSELRTVYHGRNIRRSIYKAARPLAASDILAHPSQRVLAVVNRVARAQELYRQVRAAGCDAILLHSRFFAADRNRQREYLQTAFGQGAAEPAVAIATQVVEAGLDLSADVLLTELCPMNALVQRAGRCARFDNQHGTVTVFLVDSCRPYEQAQLSDTWAAIEDGADLDPATAATWVEQVHGKSDRHLIDISRGGMAKRRDVIATGIQRTRNSGVSELIRESSDTVSVLISRNPANILPRQLEVISVWRTQLRKLQSGWTYDPDTPGFWRPFSNSNNIGFIAALHPSYARYTQAEGLTLYEAGDRESPPASRPERHISYRYRREPWCDHTDRVITRTAELISNEIPAGGLLDSAIGLPAIQRCASLAAEYHDLGKLQVRWDRWAEQYQKIKDPSYVHAVPLAHTDFDPANPHDRSAQAAAGPRPPHSAASAFFAASLLRTADVSLHEQVPILAAIVAHHGGWFQAQQPIDALLPPYQFAPPDPNKRQRFGNLVERLLDEFEIYWPLAALLTRLLRRADQKATEDFQTE